VEGLNTGERKITNSTLIFKGVFEVTFIWDMHACARADSGTIHSPKCAI